MKRNTFSGLCNLFYTILDITCCFLAIAIVMVIFLQIFCRKILNNPLTWSEELSRLVFVWMNCLGSAIVIKEKKHICFSIVVDKIFSDKGKKLLGIIIDTIIILFFIFIMYPTVSLIRSTNNIPSAALQWPSGIFYLGFALGGFVMIVAYLIDIFEIHNEFKRGNNVN